MLRFKESYITFAKIYIILTKTYILLTLMIAEFKVATPVVTNGINMLPNEINILHSVSHPYLINLEGVINTTNFR